MFLKKLRDHVAEYRAHIVETLVCSANVVRPLITQELSDNEVANRLAGLAEV